MMNTKTIARIVGACFLISNFTFILGAFALVEPALSAPNYLTLVSENKPQVILGVLLELMNAVAYIGIAVLMYQVLRKRFASGAIWYVAFRTIEFVMQTIADLSPLAMLTLSAAYIKGGGAEVSSFQTAGTLLLAQRFWAFQMVSVTLVLGALTLYAMLYKSQLIPRFISIWGLVGAAIVLINALADWFGVILPNLGVLMLANELFLGVWLIVKGFNTTAIAAEPAH